MTEMDNLQETKDGRFIFRLLKGGKVEIAGRGKKGLPFICTEERTILYIPSEIDGHPVAGIGREAYRRFWLAKEVVIASGIRYIAEGAFADCLALKRVVIPQSVTDIGQDAFNIKRKCIESMKEEWKESLIEDEKVYESENIFFLHNDILNSTFPQWMEPIFPDSYDLTLAVEKGSYALRYAQEHGFYYTDSDFVDGDFEYRLHREENGSITADVLKYKGRKRKEVIIPDRLGGYVVGDVAERAFFAHKEIESIIMARGVTRIGSWAFMNCTGLRDIKFSSCLTRIDLGAFAGCEKLRKVVLPGDVREIDCRAFQDCRKLKYIRIPGSVECIREGIFENCAKLKRVNIGEGVKGIMSNAFEGCDALREVIIPDSMAFISQHAFDCCSRDVTLVVEEHSYAERSALEREMTYRYRG